MDIPLSSIVSTEWLAHRLGATRVRPVDASWYLPSAKRDAAAEYLAGHIPGAVRFDLDAASDHASSLPHMLPGADDFAAYVGELGLSDDDTIVVYDGSAVNLSGPRAWWMFRAFGHRRTAVLNGGMVKWRAEGRPVEVGVVRLPPAVFTARLDSTRVRNAAEVAAISAGPDRPVVDRGINRPQIVDARSAGRFAGAEPEPRPGIRGGHIPGSLNLPFTTLTNPDGTLLGREELSARLAAAGVALDRPVIATCGSGVTACAIVLALDLLGHGDAAVYDGAWTEWGGRDDLPVATEA